MGTCKYCGKDAGWFSSVHKECETKHEQGLNDLAGAFISYFAQRISAVEVQRQTYLQKRDAFLSEEDICSVINAEVNRYSASLHRPFSPTSLKLVDELLSASGVTYSLAVKGGAIIDFAKKLMRGFMVEYFTGQLPLSTAHQRCEKVLARLPMAASDINDAYLYVLNKAASNFMKNGLISDSDQQKIDDYVHHLNLPINNLPAQYQGSDISKITQSSILKNLQRGIIPQQTFSAPIMLSRGESVIWCYHGVTMYQEKTERQYQGRRRGMSFRIMKGMYYHTGGNTVKPIEHTYMENKGVGTLYITNKHIIYQGDTAAQKIPYTKLIGVTPYSDGIEVHREGANAKRLTFQGFDSWFFMNVISCISNM